MPAVPYGEEIDYEIRLGSFSMDGMPSITNILFALKGFSKWPGIVICHNCGVKKDVDFSLRWTVSDIVRLHEYHCMFVCPELAAIKQRAFEISAREPRGLDKLDMRVLEEVLQMGYSRDNMLRAALAFFHDYGGFPERTDLLEYLHR